MKTKLYAGKHWSKEMGGDTCEYFEGVLWICEAGHVMDCRYPDGYGYSCAVTSCGVGALPMLRVLVPLRGSKVRPLRGRALLSAFAIGGPKAAESLAFSKGIRWARDPNNTA